MELKELVALNLLQINAIRLSPQNPFVWASGIRSPIYCDNRLVLSYPETRQVILDAFRKEAQAFKPFDVIAGVATAGIPHASILAHVDGYPLVYVRSKAKEHGRQNQIEGVIQPEQRVLVIEDLISTGGSCLAAVDVLRQAGCVVVGVLAIFQYNFDEARERFATADVPFATLSDFHTLVKTASSEGLLEGAALELLEGWSTDPHNWTPDTPQETNEHEDYQ
jgi:orotate phosphoribosyltransferase